MHAATRTALTVALQMGERFARVREEMARQAERRDTAVARELASRFDAERAAARAELVVVDQPTWWENASRADVARVAETAQTWRGLDDRAAAAADTIGREVQERYGVDVNSLPTSERRTAGEERAEAALLIAEADRLDRNTNNQAAAGEIPADVVADLEAQARSYDDAAARGGEDGKTPDELRELASDARAQAQLHHTTREAAAPSPVADTARTDADDNYDSAARRDAFAADLESRGVSSEDIKARLRADVDHARPAHEVLTSPARASRVKSPSGTPAGRQRQRGDRSR
ncbi:hypothetical protein B7R54_18750 [Subtercola boreus]|uniref:Colicin import membrane protein n=2 Tax=Subtercola boreus TaxID=120213 RepID=A0A3E0VA81_9MICO|nr:hypothetical protein B7R54_18750 [Subtercola boreus]